MGGGEQHGHRSAVEPGHNGRALATDGIQHGRHVAAHSSHGRRWSNATGSNTTGAYENSCSPHARDCATLPWMLRMKTWLDPVTPHFRSRRLLGVGIAPNFGPPLAMVDTSPEAGNEGVAIQATAFPSRATSLKRRDECGRGSHSWPEGVLTVGNRSFVRAEATSTERVRSRRTDDPGASRCNSGER